MKEGEIIKDSWKPTDEGVKCRPRVMALPPAPTLEECEWVVAKTLERNPQFFVEDYITHADRLCLLISVWRGMQGTPPSAS